MLHELMNKTYAELNVGREEVDALVSEERALDERGCNDTLLAVQATEQRVGELGTSVCHGEGRGSGTILSLNDLITTVLDAVDDLLVRLADDGLAVLCLREERDNGGTAVPTNDSDGGIGGRCVGDSSKETRSTDDIESGNTE